MLLLTYDLYIEFEFDDVAILHDISFAFGAEEAGFFDGFFGAELFEVVVFTDVGGDETSLEVSMDSAGGFGGGGAFFDGPGAALFLAGGEEGLEAESVVGGLDELF